MPFLSAIVRYPLRAILALALLCGSPVVACSPVAMPANFCPTEEEEQDSSESELKEIEAAPGESRSPADRPRRGEVVRLHRSSNCPNNARNVQSSHALCNGLSTHYRI
jgi:hypothetical protein